MVTVRLEKKDGFTCLGKKTRMGGPDNSQFARFWQKCHQDGTIDRLRTHAVRHGSGVTGFNIAGISCTEKDPSNRDFDFIIAVETGLETSPDNDLLIYTVGPFLWAIFEHEGGDIRALMACEMYAFNEWLPAGGCVHDNGPELEGYFEGEKIQFWLPVRKG